MITYLIVSVIIFAIAGIYADFYIKKEIKLFLLRNGSKPIDYWFPSSIGFNDLIRFYKVYRKVVIKTIEDKRLFTKTLINLIIIYGLILIWIIVLIFFPEFVFGE